MDINTLKKQVNLAKSHGLYGFGIYYYWFNGTKLFEEPLKLYFVNKDIDFPFLLIWRNGNFTYNNSCRNSKIVGIQQDYYQKEMPELIIKDIIPYLNDSRYIRIEGRHIIGIHEVVKINNLKFIISKWRKVSKTYGIKKLFIIASMNEYSLERIHNLTFIDGIYYFPPSSLNTNNYNFNNYYCLLYNDINFTSVNKKMTIFGGSMMEWDDSPKNGKNGTIFRDYSPEKFFLYNKKVIDWLNNYYSNEKKYIFINAWNGWEEGSYLEPDEKYGYATINALSKALFNLSYIEFKDNFAKNLKITNKIAVQCHVHFKELINEIIEKTNNIPFKFDLFITVTSIEGKNIIQQYINLNSRASKYQIMIVSNKGRDVLPFLKQMANNFKSYKYLCHIHTKKSNNRPDLGEGWRKYLFNSLMGNEDIVSQILHDFEINSSLGFIYPDTYYVISLYFGINSSIKNQKYMNYILKALFPKRKFRVGNIQIFPAGNMFWCRISSIYQIFSLLDHNERLFPKEKGQIDNTILHAIERIWLVLVKINNFYYKKIFNSI